MRNWTLLILIGSLSTTSAQALQVFSCEPEWTALVKELAGDRVDIYTATTAAQDPHFIQARPSLIAEIRKAELLVCTGAELEAGWLPLLLRRSSNRAIQIGEPGHFMAASHVRRIEVPATVDRSQGDIHPEGNPHVHLDPANIRRIATALSITLGQIDPGGTAVYAQRLGDFEARWRDASERWAEQAVPLRGLTVISHHRSFSYLAHWLGIQVLANIEPKPGIPVSSAHLAQLLKQFSENKPALIIRTPYADAKPSLWLSERLGVPDVALPYTVSEDGATNLFELFDMTLHKLEKP